MKKFLIILVASAVFFAGCAMPTTKNVTEKMAQNAGGTSSVADNWNEEWGDPEQATSVEDANHNAIIQPPEGDIVEIKEKLFIAQTNDIYLNPEDYLGKTIKYEGIFDSFYYEPAGETYYYVIRYGPGCCGYDANPGFEVAWPGEYPEPNDWVEATGILELYEEDGYPYLRICLSSLETLDKRGAEYVNQ